jgi:hypothetical protein
MAADSAWHPALPCRKVTQVGGEGLRPPSAASTAHSAPSAPLHCPSAALSRCSVGRLRSGGGGGA